ncbi:MAG TPA: carboxypeptidase-like regulatory domain-containing protein [Planctomycetota bacterium]|nr:carboxypeptidase-like regulatory domain-containing protein [Planctomycetota bacterium]
MLRESWKRPSVVVVGWALVLLAVFIVRGDLRVDAEPPVRQTVARRASEPVVVRPERAARVPAVPSALRQGRVFDSLGYLVVGAEVIAAERASERTDADGEFRLDLPERRFTDVCIRAKGRLPVWLQAQAISPDPLVVQLAPEAPWDAAPSAPAPVAFPLAGEGIVRAPDGSPLVGAYVKAVGTELWSRTDEIGRYVLPLATSTPTLLVHCPDNGADQRGFAARSEPLELGRSSGVVPLPELVASPAGNIRGTVRDVRGTPLAGVPVQLRGEGVARVFESGAGGIFRFSGLLPGRYEVRPLAFRGSVGQARDVLLDSPVADCDLHMKSAAERRLRVVDEGGSPVGLVYVSTSIEGQRRGVAQADALGWAAVPVAEQTDFDVRTPEHAPMAVRRFDAEPATLVVALP